MKARLFAELPQFDILMDDGRLKVGDKFLYGQSMKRQVDEKKVGDMISYYKVIKVKPNGNVEYIPVYEKLEE